MRGRPNPRPVIPGERIKNASKEFPPTESQIKAAESIAEKLEISLPEVFTKRAYSQFISNHMKNKEERRWQRNGRTDDAV